MHDIVNMRRRYDTSLRDQQAQATRDRILDATVRTMAGGVAGLSIPEIAREAGVSVPTVYRHFGSKQELLAAVYPHIERRAGLSELVMPGTIGELRESARSILERLDAFDDLARAAMASPAAGESRQMSMARRVEIARRLADTVRPKLRDADRDRIARLLVILTSSASLRTLRDHLGRSVDEAADDVEWMVNAAIAGALGRPRTSGRGESA